MPRPWLTILTITAACLIGCADKNADIRGSVRGRVTLDGSPLATGGITFEPTKGTRGPKAGGEIVNGGVTITTANGPAIGTNLVRVSSLQPTGKKVPGGLTGELIDELAEIVPKHYNTATTLEVEIKKGRNDLNLDLQSK